MIEAIGRKKNCSIGRFFDESITHSTYMYICLSDILGNIVCTHTKYTRVRVRARCHSTYSNSYYR